MLYIRKMNESESEIESTCIAWQTDDRCDAKRVKFTIAMPNHKDITLDDRRKGVTSGMNKENREENKKKKKKQRLYMGWLEC